MKHYLMAVAAAVFVGVAAAYGEETGVSREQLKAEELPEYNQLRDPFWAVGHVRQVVPKTDSNSPTGGTAVVSADITPVWPQLKLKAVTSSPKGYIAIIEGVGLVEEGQIIKMEAGGIVYRWKILTISEKGFSHKQLDAKSAK
jgi:hypothetical protein